MPKNCQLPIYFQLLLLLPAWNYCYLQIYAFRYDVLLTFTQFLPFLTSKKRRPGCTNWGWEDGRNILVSFYNLIFTFRNRGPPSLDGKLLKTSRFCQIVRGLVVLYQFYTRTRLIGGFLLPQNWWCHSQLWWTLQIGSVSKASIPLLTGYRIQYFLWKPDRFIMWQN